MIVENDLGSSSEQDEPEQEASPVDHQEDGYKV